jgi:hypothetical protein
MINAFVFYAILVCPQLFETRVSIIVVLSLIVTNAVIKTYFFLNCT